MGGVLLTGAVLSIYQVMVGTDRSNSQIVALTDINQAALRIKKDIMMSQSTDLTDNVSQPDSVLLGWTDYTGNLTGHSISYALSGIELQRDYDDTVSIVGRNITAIAFTQNGRVINVVITATGPGASQRNETLEFSVYRRAEVVLE